MATATRIEDDISTGTNQWLATNGTCKAEPTYQTKWVARETVKNDCCGKWKRKSEDGNRRRNRAALVVSLFNEGHRNGGERYPEQDEPSRNPPRSVVNLGLRLEGIERHSIREGRLLSVFPVCMTRTPPSAQIERNPYCDSNAKRTTSATER